MSKNHLKPRPERLRTFPFSQYFDSLFPFCGYSVTEGLMSGMEPLRITYPRYIEKPFEKPYENKLQDIQSTLSFTMYNLMVLSQ